MPLAVTVSCLTTVAGPIRVVHARTMRIWAPFALVTDASPESRGGSVTSVLLGFTTSQSVFHAAAMKMGWSQEYVIHRRELASAR